MGPAGATGPAGQPPVAAPEPAGDHCAAGGVKYTTALGAVYVCNGLAGPQGTTGPSGQQGEAGTAKAGCATPPDATQTALLPLLLAALGLRRRNGRARA